MVSAGLMLACGRSELEPLGGPGPRDAGDGPRDRAADAPKDGAPLLGCQDFYAGRLRGPAPSCAPGLFPEVGTTPGCHDVSCMEIRCPRYTGRCIPCGG